MKMCERNESGQQYSPSCDPPRQLQTVSTKTEDAF